MTAQGTMSLERGGAADLLHQLFHTESEMVHERPQSRGRVAKLIKSISLCKYEDSRE